MNSDMLLMALAVIVSGLIVLVLTLVFAASHNAAPAAQRSFSGGDYTRDATSEPNQLTSRGAALMLRLIALPMLLILGVLLAYILVHSS